MLWVLKNLCCISVPGYSRTMGTIILLLLLDGQMVTGFFSKGYSDRPTRFYRGVRPRTYKPVMEYGKAAHVILKEPPRYRLAYDDWKPVREGPNRQVRYPVYRKASGYPYIPGKKISHQIAEQSEKIEVFSPAPPTILGSFSVFGHATVNAREHASHISKKSPRPQYSDFTAAESRPKVSSYQVRHHYLPTYSNYNYGEQKRPQYNEFNDQVYFHEASLRPPPHDSSKPYVHPAPTSYYSYDHNFQTEKYRKTPKVPQSSYAQSSYKFPATVYSHPLSDFKTTVPPNDYDSTYSYFNSPSSNIDTEYYNENPVGAVPLSIRRPESDLKPVTESNTIHDQLTHIGRPFQNPHLYPTVDTIKGTIQPFVSTYPSLSTVETRVKFSDVAQPFRVSNYETGQIPSSKPESGPQTFTEEMYPISVTTIDVPTEVDTQIAKDIYDDYSSKQTPFKPSPYDNSKHKPYKNSYHDNNGNPIFLPTPSTDISPYLSEPKNEITTINPEPPSDFQDTNFIPSIENKVVEPNETPTEMYTTIAIETTTKSKPHKSRRPSRPTSTPSTTTLIDSEDYKYQRRRKPVNKYRTRGSVEKNNYKRQRTTTTSTTTTTHTPEISEEFYHFTTVIPENSSPQEKDRYEYTGEKIERPEIKDYEEEQANHKYVDTDEGKINVVEAITSTSTTTLPTTISSPQMTISTTTESRLKSKYGSRPRFSIKDYRDKLNKATSTVAPHESEKIKPTRNETEFKFGGKTRISTSRTTTTTESPQIAKVSSEPKFQKYKPRLGPSRYKTSTTAAPETDTTTTERSNTFKPSTNRYKPGTGKYYSRYRTSTIPPKEVDDSPATTSKISIRPKGVFSAKRQPFPLKTKTDIAQSDNDDNIEEQDFGKFTESLKLNENEVYSAVLKKIDDSTTTTMSSEEDESEREIEKDPTGQESLRIADLTSSSSNDFRHSSYLKNGAQSASRRPIPKITLPTDNPILPLEAFFQTQNN